MGLDILTVEEARRLALSDNQPIGQRFMHKAKAAKEHLVAANIGDSLGDATDEYFYRWGLWLAATFPTHTITYRVFSGSAYASSGVVIASGSGTANATVQESLLVGTNVTSGGQVQRNSSTGAVEPLTSGTAIGTAASTQTAGNSVNVNLTAPTIRLYNAGVSGTGYDYPIGKAQTQTIGPIAPDLAFVMYGHNEGVVVGYDFASRAWAGIEAVAVAAVDCEIIVVSQNREVSPATNAGDYQVQRAAMLREICARRGFGFVDACTIFENLGASLSSYINSDGVHPRQSAPNDGQALIVNAITQAMAYRSGMSPARIQLDPAFRVRTGVPIYGTDFQSASWDGTTAGLVSTFGWTLNNITAAKDSTNFETINGAAYSVALTRTSSGTVADMTHDSADFANYKGQYVSLLVRVWVPTGASGNIARPRLDDGVTSFTTWSWLSPGSAFNSQWIWACVQGKVSASATRLRARLYVDSGGSSSPSPSYSLQRVCLVRGLIPRDYV